MQLTNFAVQAGLWLVFSVVVMSFVEHYIHRNMMHRKHFLGTWIKPVERIFVHHASKHHPTYAVTFFDEVVPKGTDRHIRLSVKEGFVESLPFSLAFGYFFWWPAAVIFTGVVCGHHLLWNQIHLEMHKPDNRFFSKWRAFKFVREYHAVHHKFPATNFNVVLPVADLFMGTMATKQQYLEATTALHNDDLAKNERSLIAAGDR
jgi:hypothetical protein